MGPLVTIEPEGLLYVKVRAEDVPEIVRQTLVKGLPVERLLFVEPATGATCRGVADIPFYTRQQRFVLRDCGVIDPEDLGEYRRSGGYLAAKRAWTEL